MIDSTSNKTECSFEMPEYRFATLDEIYEQSTEVQWLIEDYIPRQSIGMLYGPSGVGKTHIVLDMAARIANGIPWYGNDTEQGVVLVMAGEGQGGLKRRLQSIEKRHDFEIDRNNLFFSERALGVDTDKGFSELIGAIEALEQQPDLIIVDTLSRHLMSSSENSNEDMASFINKLEQIKQKYDTSIMIVHHTGKSEKSGARGASSIRANIDFSFVLSKFTFAGKSLCDLECEKQKDASDNVPKVSFQIVTVALGEEDSKGREIQGACAHRVDVQTESEEKTDESVALEAFANKKAEWQERFLAMYDEEVEHNLKPDSLKKKFRAVVEELVAKGLVKQLAEKEFELPTP